MKKNLFIILISTTFALNSFAFTENIFNVINSGNSQIKSFFNIENKEKIEPEAKQEQKINTQNNTNSKRIKEEAKTDIKTELKAKDEVVCEAKSKLLSKRDRVNNNIKTQIKDKNKLTENLLLIAKDINSEEFKNVIQDVVINLETETSSAIKIQRDIVNTISSTTDMACNIDFELTSKESKEKELREISTFTKEVSKKERLATSTILLNKIKTLEGDRDRQLEKINKIIKTDIKSLLVEIKEEENK